MSGKKAKIKLSQCMIVKNEEQNIEKALSWGKDFVCEQIVVDTGSTDKTVELAEKNGAKVFFYPWKDDFSAAKNYAIEKAEGDWIAFLDADEYFPEEDARKLIKEIEQIDWNKEVDFIRTKIVHIDEEGGVMGSSCQDRIFRNTLRYRYRIHEQLYDRKKPRLGCFDLQERLMILHTGYGQQANRPEKGARNARLLEQDLKEYPGDALRLMYLGDAYNIADREEEALACYRKVLWESEVQPGYEVAFLRAGLQILRTRAKEPPEATESEFTKVCKRLKEFGGDDHPDTDYFMGYWHLKKNEVETAAVFFENALEKLEKYNGAEITKMTVDLELPNRVIAAAALASQDFHKAVKFAVTALRLQKYSPDSLKILLKAFFTEWNQEQPVEPYWSLLCQIYERNNLKDLLFLNKMANTIGFTKLGEYIWEQIPQEVKQFL